MSEKRPAPLLFYDILESINKVENYTRTISFDELMRDERTKDAILRNIQIIGDASKNIPESIIWMHPEVDWSGVAGMRDIITHRYFRVDWHLIWESIHDELPPFKVHILNLVKELEK